MRKRINKNKRTIYKQAAYFLLCMYMYIQIMSMPKMISDDIESQYGKDKSISIQKSFKAQAPNDIRSYFPRLLTRKNGIVQVSKKRTKSPHSPYSVDPKYLAQGAYGCVHNPSMHCYERRKKGYYKGKVSKIMTTDAAESEIKEYSKMRDVDPDMNYYLGPPDKCSPIVKNLDEKYLYDCDNLVRDNEDMFTRDGKNKNENKFKLLIMKNGGMDLRDFTNTKSKFLDKAGLETILVELYRMMMGIHALLDKGLIHHDLKGDNIVYNEKDKRMNFIDFGLIESINTVKAECRASEYGFNIDYFIWPFETRFLVKDSVTETGDIDLMHFKNYIFQKRSKLLDIEIYQQIDKDYKNFINSGFMKNHEAFMTKHFNTVDIYGLGMTCLRILLKYKELLKNPALQAKLYKLFYSMITPDLRNRIEISELLRIYTGLLTDYDVGRDHFNKLYMELNGTSYSDVESKGGRNKSSKSLGRGKLGRGVKCTRRNRRCRV